MEHKYLLGVDVGTTGTKTMLFRQDGVLMGQAYRGYPIHTPRVGHCEQDPGDWWNALCATVKEVSRDPGVRGNIVAMSLSTQGGTTVGVDAEGKPVRPAMVWNDQRCREELAELKEELPELSVYKLCGWGASTAMPALQYRWLRKQEPENHARIRQFLSVPDYLCRLLTGKAVIDISNAGICRFADITQGTYRQELLDFAGLTPEQLPRILPSGAPVGTLTPQAAKKLELPQSVQVITGAHDQYAMSLGAGACKEGDILIGSGTSWVVTSLSKAPDFSSGLAQSVSAVPGLWGSLRSLSSGGVCLEWLRKKIADEPDYDTINQEVDQRKAAEEGLFFFPFAGQWKSGAYFKKGSFLGLDLSHDKFHMARAIMEGVAFQILWMMEAFRAQPGEEGILLSGGAGKSRVWCQILADAAGLPVQIPEEPNLSCVGAAMLAGVGCGLFLDIPTAVKTLGVARKTLLPDPQRSRLYRQLYEKYKTLAEIAGSMQ